MVDSQPSVSGDYSSWPAEQGLYMLWEHLTKITCYLNYRVYNGNEVFFGFSRVADEFLFL